MKPRCILFWAATAIAAAARAGTITYTYDDAGQLTRADYGGGRHIRYTYDPAGNLLERVVAAGGLSQADLALIKRGAPVSFEIGQGNLFYTLTVSNAGPDAAQNVQVSDTLPVQVLFAMASTGTVSGGTFTASLGDLAGGASLDIQLQVVPLTTGVAVNAASVLGDTTDPNPANNTALATNVILAAVDGDANGLADWWEQHYFPNPADRVAAADFDRDGASNGEEQGAGTDPTQSNSCFRITRIGDPPYRTIAFHGASGRVFAVSWNSNLLSGLWAALATNLPGVGATVTVTDTNAAAQRVYRAEAAVP